MSADAQTMSGIRDGARPTPRWTLADAEQSCATPFERHAARQPEQLAVLSRTARLTYGELNSRANRLAHALIARAARGDRVALALGHEAAMIVGLLAVWKAGMVAVPLEMTHPVERLAIIVADAGCAVIVSEPSHQSVAAELTRHGAQYITVDEPGNDRPDSDPRLEIAPGDLACLVYTSGSTGKPKGVMQSHRCAMRNVVGYSNVIAILPEDRLVLLASCAAAQGLSTVTCALANGAALFPFNVRDAGVEALAQFIREHAITLYISAATIFRHLVLTLTANEVLDSVRMVRLGSEPIHGSDAAAFRRHFRPDCTMLSALSCTETANITLHQVDPARDADLASVPVGWPVDGMEVLLLDETGNDVGIEREGEIVVRSRYLSSGYWRDEQRTAAVFVEGVDGSDLRCYRTGDYGRRRADGCLIHAGRRDFRVKVRGFGIELEEVETVLRQHARVKAAVASVRQDKLGDNYLVAYLVTQPGEPPTLEDVQQHVLGRLAAHMMPAEFFVIDTLPLTPNGKVDRRAVATLSGKVLRKSSPSLPPRTALERQLIRTWEDVLTFRPIGVNDDFFAIGGNSLLAGLVISRVATAFEIELPLRAFLESSTIAGLARVVRRKRFAHISGGVPALARVPRDAPIPASFAQQRLWLLEQIEPGSNAYNLPRAIRLEGRLDCAALERALREIVRRHETLRTTFATANDQPVQVIAEPGRFTLTLVDCAAATDDPGTTERRMREQLEAEAMRPFDLSRGPLFRAALFRLSDVEHVLLLNLHHIISDLWSNAVLTRELSELYTAFSQGQPSTLPELAVHYADFAVWQRERLQGALLKRQCDYWSAQLAGLPALDLPTDRPRTREPATASAMEPVEIPPELTAALGKLARDSQCTLYMTLLAVFQALLHRYTGQEDFAVGGVIAGRNRVEVEALIGFFINTLVHRADLSGHPTFLELLGRVRDSALGAFEHQDLPFERLVEELNPPRDPNRTPFFQVTFLLQNTPRTKLAMPGLTVTNLHTGRGAAKFDLTFSLHEEEGRLRGGVEFNPALFDRGTVQRLIGHYRTLCESVVSDPSRKVAELPMLTPAERTELLVAFNRPTAAPLSRALPLDGGATLSVLFEAQVRRTPDAVALTCDGESLTYAALDDRADVLAQRLRAIGVGTDVLVGLCLVRSIEVVVAIVAILKAGGAYLPIDLAYPAARVAFMLEDAQAPVLLTQGKVRARLPATKAAVVCVDDEVWNDVGTLSGPDERGGKPPYSQTAADHLAYVIYTSGTTGKPKGTQITHRNVVRLFSQTEHWFGFDERDVWTLFHSYAFDFSVWEIWGALLYGGRLVVVPPHVSRAPDAFYALLAQERVTVLNQTPSAFRQLMLAETTMGAQPLALRYVIFGGESLGMQSLRPWFDRHGDQSPRLVNMYGITETTVHVTYRPLSRSDVAATGVIGVPISDMQVYILDARGQPVPIGVPGEIYVGGAGLARGYLRRPELTAERFVPDHLGGTPGARLYRSGDLARFRPGREIEYLGRIDHQVKIRGFRIELGEIEAVVREHPAVVEAVVTTWADYAGEHRLVAYVTLSPDNRPATAELRSHLQGKLPDYMVPGVIVVLEQMPLTPNGKVDRRALPAPDAIEAGAERALVAPRTEAESKVAAVWRDVLKLPRVSVQDNFFDLGGHSLLAMKAAAQISAATGCKLPMRWLFDCPTIAALAVRIGSAPEAQSGERIIPLARGDRLALSHQEQRLWFLHHALSDPSTYNVPWVTRLRGPLDVARLRNALRVVMQRHEILRTGYVDREGVATRVIGEDLNVPLVVHDLHRDDSLSVEARIGRFVAEEAARPFALESPPLFRASCLRLGDEDHVFVLNLHHIICDEWSLQILRHEVETLYAASGNATAELLPELPLQYADFAAWQCRRVASNALDPQREHWRRRMQDAALTIELPFDRRWPDQPTSHGGRRTFHLEQGVVAALERLGAPDQTTPFMVWLAAFAAFLSRVSGQPDLVIGTPVAGRDRPELQSLIGLFLNTLPLRVTIDASTDFRSLLNHVRNLALEAFEHGELTLDEIVAAGSTVRRASGLPLFSVMFVMHQETPEPWNLRGTTGETMPSGMATAKAELTLFLGRRSDGRMHGMFEFSTDVFDATSIERMIEQFVRLVESISGSPGPAVGRLQLLPETQRRVVVHAFNATAATYQRDATVHALFEQCAEATPGATALVLGPHKIPYAVLNERANRLAHHVRALGVHAGDRVALLLDRSIELVVSVLATLKAGAVYVPIDPHTPAERLRFMLEDTAARVLITHGALPFDLRVSGITTLDLAQESTVIAQCAITNPETGTTGSDPAYIMYTSGSTGRPKGVVIPHRGIVRLVHGQDYAPFAPEQRFLLLASPAFDASTFELWGALLSGATCVIFPERWPDPELLETEIRTQGVTCLWLTAGLFNQIIDQRPSVLATVRYVIMGGEALSVPHVQRALARWPHLQLVNGYGPTESTTFACTYPIPKDCSWPGSSVPIGRPIAHTCAYILDPQGQPVPIGGPGELHLGGDGLASGYWNRPDLTAEKFVPDAFAARPGARVYRTGDRCRWLADGTIEFLGRLDEQVKLRGFRIELGEIEAVLREHPAAAGAVATTWDKGHGERSLVAYVTLHPGDRPGITELRAFLQRRLPDYMVPAAIVVLDQLPLTPNGKVDRKALPEPELAEAAPVQAWVAPRTHAEELVAAIWRDVLRLPRVGVHDGFFALGGHSLLAMQVVSRVRRTFDCNFPLRVLFDHPTVAGLAAAVTGLSLLTLPHPVADIASNPGQEEGAI